MNTWQLPEGVDELTGDRALVFERVRRQLIDLYTNKGFGLVIPPMVENIESLLLTSESVNKKTFKFLDPSSGKMLGVHLKNTAKSGAERLTKICLSAGICSSFNASCAIKASNTATFPKLSTIGSMASNFKLSSINTITSISASMLLEPYNSAPA
jgi:hypothetical protein